MFFSGLKILFHSLEFPKFKISVFNGHMHVSVIIKILENRKSQSRKYRYHGRGHFSVHRDQLLTNSDTRGFDLVHLQGSRVASDVKKRI